jgi:hypothetical protein
MEVQDGASETMRNSTERFAFWPGAIIHEHSKHEMTAVKTVTLKQKHRNGNETAFLQPSFPGA